MSGHDGMFERSMAEKVAHVRSVLEAEMSKRRWVFRDDPEKRAAKVGECQMALYSLDDIEKELVERGIA